MLYNTSYTNNDYTKECNKIVGKSFSVFEKVKMRGVGSSRLLVSEFSSKLKPENLLSSATNYVNIELRPKGVIMHFTNGLDRYSWIIPYYRLVIYNTQTFSVHANGHFIKCKKDRYYKDSKKFLKKMTDLKNDFLNLDYYDA